MFSYIYNIFFLKIWQQFLRFIYHHVNSIQIVWRRGVKCHEKVSNLFKLEQNIKKKLIEGDQIKA